jgi:hypothetical protein
VSHVPSIERSEFVEDSLGHMGVPEYTIHVTKTRASSKSSVASSESTASQLSDDYLSTSFYMEEVDSAVLNSVPGCLKVAYNTSTVLYLSHTHLPCLLDSFC